MSKIQTVRSIAIAQKRIVPNASKPTNIVSGPNGWVIVPDIVKA